jgi:hypothetical protein
VRAEQQHLQQHKENRERAKAKQQHLQQLKENRERMKAEQQHKENHEGEGK